MTKYKTEELTGELLNRAVAKALNRDFDIETECLELIELFKIRITPSYSDWQAAIFESDENKPLALS